LGENKPWVWVFSGFGVAVPIALIGWLSVDHNNPITATDGGVAIRDTQGSPLTHTDSGDINQGLMPEQLHELIADQHAEHQGLQDELTELKVQLGVTEQALRTFFGILEREVPPEQWPVRLAEIAHRHKQALERLAVLEIEDSEAQALIGEAKTTIEAGDYGRAEDLLDQAEARELANLEKMQAAVERRRLSAAAVRAEHRPSSR